jgi:hypothetical protein
MTKAYALLAAAFLLLGAAACQAGERKVISVQVIPDEMTSTPASPMEVVPAEMIHTVGTPVEVIPAEMTSTPGGPVEIVPAEMTSAPETPAHLASSEMSCAGGNCGCQGADHGCHWEALHEWLTYHHQRCHECRRCTPEPCCSPHLYMYFLCPNYWGHGAHGCATCGGNDAVIGSWHPGVSSATSPETISTVAMPEGANDAPYPVVSSEPTPATHGQAMYIASPQQMNRLLSSGLPAGTVIMAIGPDGRPMKESAVTLGR